MKQIIYNRKGCIKIKMQPQLIPLPENQTLPVANQGDLHQPSSHDP